MTASLTNCPVCSHELTITELKCESCDTTIRGRFNNSAFANLSAEQSNFLLTFVRCEGKLNRVETELGLSYPTLRNKLMEVIRALGFEPGREESSEIGEEVRRKVLDDLDNGVISAEEAMRILRGE
ncbi:MAG TPA: DUF2089 domain-containing protein [Anaerolineales bacterium]|nr:DUF2089 domain-containing protein [Anaerolineales bacterium]